MPNTSTAGRFGRLGWLWLTLLVLVIDQASKVYFDGALQMYQQIVIIPDYFQLDFGLQHWRRFQLSG